MLTYLPTEPTKEMLDAAVEGYAEEYKEHRRNQAKLVYETMVKAYIELNTGVKITRVGD